MPPVKPRERQSFEDGTLTVCRVENIQVPGGIPRKGIRPAVDLRYQERSVGVRRYWDAKREGIETSRVLRVPYHEMLRPGMVLIPTDGDQYDLRVVQPIMGLKPPCMDLTLERRTDRYELEDAP